MPAPKKDNGWRKAGVVRGNLRCFSTFEPLFVLRLQSVSFEFALPLKGSKKGGC